MGNRIMVTASHIKPTRLEVSNFGPISEANVELRPLTVFVGPSNTGKSYLAVLTYALHQFFGAYRGVARKRNLPGMPDPLGLPLVTPIADMDLSASDIDNFYAWAATERLRIDLAIQSGKIPPDADLPPEVSGMVRRALVEVGSLGAVLSDEIVRCFGFDTPEKLVLNSANELAEHSMSTVVSDDPAGDEAYRYEIHVDRHGAIVCPTVPDHLSFTITENLPFPWFLLSSDDVGPRRDHNARVHLAVFASAALSFSVGALGHPAHYLPADRAGVMHAHQVTVRGLIAGASRVALRPGPSIPILSGVLGDFLEQLVALGSASPGVGGNENDNLARLLEAGLMKGSVRVEHSEIDYPSFVYRPDGWEQDLPLMNSSSMVSELAPVVLYLRHVVQPGDTLIIEEPESHLHPAMQVEFTRLLARAVKAGIRIIITTHSEWVLEELANLVLMSELPVEQRHGFEGADLALGPEELGVWSFQPTEDGSMVEELRFDEEVGKFPSDAGLVTTDLYNRYAKISNRIERLKEG